MAVDEIPPQILSRKKEAFVMPFDNWLRTELRPMIDIVFSKDCIDRRGLFDYNEMKKIYNRFYLSKETPWVDIWSFVILEFWLAQFCD